jgi:glycine C-acetyltransferase
MHTEGRRVNEFVELANWFGWRVLYEPVVLDRLPGPTFTVKDRKRISFRTNNYLGLSTSPRLKAAAKGIGTHGVGNSDSRLLGGNLVVYGELEQKIARSNGDDLPLSFSSPGS